MFKTETVYVHAPTSTENDPFGAPINVDGDPIAVDVLVYEYSSSDLTEDNRPDGRQLAYGLHFPKTWSGGNLDSRFITVRGEVCKVVGAPRPHTPENTPTRWNMLVQVERSDG